MYLFLSVLSATLSASLLFGLLLLLRPFIEKHLSAAGFYGLLILLLLRLLLPFSPDIFAIPTNDIVVHYSATMDLSRLEGETNDDTEEFLAAEDKPEEVNQILQEKAAADMILITEWKRRVMWRKVIVWVWAIGTFVKFGVNVYLYFSYRRRIMRHTDYSEHNTALLKAIADGRRCPKVFVSAQAGSPMTIGLVNTKIILPAAYLSPETAENILRHEYSHFRRGDLLVKWLCVMACALHWFNPVTIPFRKALNEWCELACDETAVKDMDSDGRKSYIHTLLDMMAYSANLKKLEKIPLTGLSNSAKKMNKRLENIAAIKKTSTKTKLTSAALALSVAVSSLLLGACGNQSLGNAAPVSDSSFGEMADLVTNLDAAWNNYTYAGVVSEPQENILEYNGEPITFTYEFGSDNACTMGLVIYVNGMVQSYTELSGGETTEMFVARLSDNDNQQFEFAFTPICGRKGDVLRAIFANVYYPEIFELNDRFNTFGNFHYISQPMPWTLIMNTDASASAADIGKEYTTQKFTDEEILDFLAPVVVFEGEKEGRTKLDDNCLIEFRRDSKELDNDRVKFSTAQDNPLALYVYGNSTGTYRVSLYGDLKRIPLDGHDYVEVEVVEGQYAVIPFTFSAEDAKTYKNLYAVAVPTDDVNFLSKTRSIYIETK